jgi:MFS family permease
MSSAVTKLSSAATARAASHPRHGFGFWAVAYAFMAVMAYSAVPTPLYVLYQQRDGFSSFMITVIFGVYAVGVVVSLFTAGHISDWQGRRRLMLAAVVLSLAGAMIFLLWQDLAALIFARFISGLAVGVVTATATAWIAELHAEHRPARSARRAQIVGMTANLGGIGLGPLVAGVLAQWVADPLTVPFAVSIGALALALILVGLSPETRERATPRPRYRTQRISVPTAARARYFAAAVAAFIAFAAFGLFTSLAPSFLAATLHHSSLALAGATAFGVFAAAVLGQIAITILEPGTRAAVAFGAAGLSTGFVVVVVSVWLTHPSLALFLLGGVIAGAGAGILFKGAIGTAGSLAIPERRAEALAGVFLSGYVGLTVPVVGLGVLTQYVAVRDGLVMFAAALILLTAVAAPLLLRRGPREEGGSRPNACGGTERVDRGRGRARLPLHVGASRAWHRDGGCAP